MLLLAGVGTSATISTEDGNTANGFKFGTFELLSERIRVLFIIS